MGPLSTAGDSEPGPVSGKGTPWRGLDSSEHWVALWARRRAPGFDACTAVRQETVLAGRGRAPRTLGLTGSRSASRSETVQEGCHLCDVLLQDFQLFSISGFCFF